MKKYLMETYNVEYSSNAIVNAENLNKAFVEFIEYHGIPYPLEKSDIENMMKDFTLEKFITYFEEINDRRVHRIYEIKETIFEKNFEAKE